MDIEVLCGHADLAPISELKKNPRNPNEHSEEQIARLAKLIKHHGFRHPIIISKQSGFIVAGHARLDAATRLGMRLVPVEYQSFESEDMEWAFLISDNAIAGFSELDLAAINLEIPNIGPLDLELLGLQDFTVDPPLVQEEKAPKEMKYFECPNCHEVCEKQQLIPAGIPNG